MCIVSVPRPQTGKTNVMPAYANHTSAMTWLPRSAPMNATASSTTNRAAANITTSAVEVAAKNATAPRAATSVFFSARDTIAQGATAAKTQIVFVIVATFSYASTGISTTRAATTRRTTFDPIQPWVARYRNN